MDENTFRIAQTGVVPGGRLYEVDINAMPEQFLSLGTRIKEQAPYIRERIESLPNKQYAVGKTGEQFLKWMGQDKATGVLRDLGIVGTKHLDRMAAESGRRSNAYVVFDPELISIISKR
jgi:hypothetical protein